MPEKVNFEESLQKLEEIAEKLEPKPMEEKQEQKEEQDV